MKNLIVSAVLFFCAVTSMAWADTQATYDVKLVGLTIGEMSLSGRENSKGYSTRSRFRTIGAVGVLAKVRYDLQSKGGRQGAKLFPSSYTEYIHTGKRESTTELRFQSGIARPVGEPPKPRGTPPTKAQIKGALDPMSALYAVIRDQEAETVCTQSVGVYDGVRYSKMVMRDKQVTETGIKCRGELRRIAGYKPKELDRQTVFPFVVTFKHVGQEMQATKIWVKSTYGNVVLDRR